MLSRTTFTGLVPVEVDLARRGLGADGVRHIVGEISDLGGIVTADAVLDRPSDRRTHLERRDAPDQIVEIGGQRLLQPLT